MRLSAIFPCLMAGVLMSACSTNQDTTSEGAPLARQLTAASQCGFSAPTLVHMDSASRVEHVASERGLNLATIDDHDFESEHLLLVASGNKPTGGYGIALEDSRIRDNVLEITVKVRSPGPDQMVTQAITSPCAVLAVASADWERIQVSGPEFGELSLQR